MVVLMGGVAFVVVFLVLVTLVVMEDHLDTDLDAGSNASASHGRIVRKEIDDAATTTGTKSKGVPAPPPVCETVLRG